jgi:Site-specific recombinase XerD
MASAYKSEIVGMLINSNWTSGWTENPDKIEKRIEAIPEGWYTISVYPPFWFAALEGGKMGKSLKGKELGKGISQRKDGLFQARNRAMESDLLNKNVALSAKTKIDNGEQEEKRVLTEDEIRLLLDVSKDGQLYPLFVVALHTGMRIGEITGLTWDCVDFRNGMIYVTKILCYLPNKGDAIYEFHPPKTKAGKRNIPMSKLVKETLLVQKKWHDKVSSRFAPRQGLENLVFTSKTNNPLHNTNIRESIDYLVDKINRQYPDVGFKRFTPHCLRHTFATNCIAKGMNPKTLQKLLGHNSLQMTMDLYCHVLDETLKEEMSTIAEMV